ncbi:MAG: hypothetical protein PHP83_03915 [Clostridia bacterium]|nr:hypothetical protein [Clostridia bacterium]
MENETTYIGYVNLKNSTIFTIGEFSIWWNVFEDQKCECACSYDEILKLVSRISEVGKSAFKEFAIELKNRAKQINPAFTTNQYVSQKLYPSDRRARITNTERNNYMQIVINFIDSNGENHLDGALLAIWRIRNNMFHGLKGHSELEEQVNLFKAMIGVLKEVVEN